MGWLAALIAIMPVTIAIVSWVLAWLSGPSGTTAEKPDDQQRTAGYLRFQPPVTDDVFQCSAYYSALAKKRMLIWDYRDKRGALHSGVAPSLEQATHAAEEFGYHPNNGNNNNSRTA